MAEAILAIAAVVILIQQAVILKARARRKKGEAEKKLLEGLIVIRYYLALRGAENGVTAMVTPFFCVQGWISQQQARKSQESLHHPRS